VFITFEGGEGSGKTSQVKLLSEYCKKVPHILTREPGGTEIANSLRNVLLSSKYSEIIEAETEFLIYTAARIQHLKNIIEPALKENKIVLCDRYIDSTIAYQVYGRGLDLEKVSYINEQLLGIRMPDMTFFFDCPPELALKRGRQREHESGSHHDRFEKESLAFHQKVYTGFLNLCRQNPNRIFRIDASRSVSDIHQELIQILNE